MSSAATSSLGKAVRGRSGSDSAGARPARGFSLAELLICITVILVLAVIALPSLLKSKAAANEASAGSTLRTLNTECASYLTINGVYPPDLPTVAPALASGSRSGYVFSYTLGAAGLSYQINADPISTTTGERHLYTDSSGVIRTNWTSPATTADNPL